MSATNFTSTLTTKSSQSAFLFNMQGHAAPQRPRAQLLLCTVQKLQKIGHQPALSDFNKYNRLELHARISDLHGHSQLETRYNGTGHTG